MMEFETICINFTLLLRAVMVCSRVAKMNIQTIFKKALEGACASARRVRRITKNEDIDNPHVTFTEKKEELVFLPTLILLAHSTPAAL